MILVNKIRKNLTKSAIIQWLEMSINAIFAFDILILKKKGGGGEFLPYHSMEIPNDWKHIVASTFSIIPLFPYTYLQLIKDNLLI